jgi:hypothetical protein
MGEGIVAAMIVIIAFLPCTRLLANKLDTGSAWRYPAQGPTPFRIVRQGRSSSYYEWMDQAHRLPRLPPVLPAKVRALRHGVGNTIWRQGNSSTP